MNLHDRDLIRITKREALTEGAQLKAIEAAKSFYDNGVSVEIIAKALKMTQEQVLQIVKK